MTALNEAVRSDPDPTARPRRSLRIDRIVVGILLVAVGAGWLLARLGVAVPWRLGAPIALTLVGVTLIIAVLTASDGGVRAGRSGLAWIGAALLALSVALGSVLPSTWHRRGTSASLRLPVSGPWRSVGAWAMSIWTSPRTHCLTAERHWCTSGPATSR